MPRVTPAERRRLPYAADERTTLVAFLDWHRDTLRIKTAGLDAEQLDTPLPPSDLTLGGMLKHLALVEESWFCRWLGRDMRQVWKDVDWSADPDWEWRTAADDSPEELRALWEESVGLARASLDEALREGGMDKLATRSWPDGRSPNLRWIVCHMIEEYARHNGHADLIRESIDGATGE